MHFLVIIEFLHAGGGCAIFQQQKCDAAAALPCELRRKMGSQICTVCDAAWTWCRQKADGHLELLPQDPASGF